MKGKIKSNKYEEIVLKTYAYHPLSQKDDDNKGDLTEENLEKF